MKIAVAIMAIVMALVLLQNGVAENFPTSARLVFCDKNATVLMLPTTYFADAMMVESHLERAIKCLEKLCGPPVRPADIQIIIHPEGIRNLFVAGQTDFLGATTIIRLRPPVEPQTLVHELFHTWHRPVIMPECFMEGMAIAVSAKICQKLHWTESWKLADWQQYNKCQLAGDSIYDELPFSDWRSQAWGGFWLHWIKKNPSFPRRFLQTLKENDYPHSFLSIKDRGICEFFCEQATLGFTKFAKNQPIYGESKLGRQIIVIEDNKFLKIVVFDREKKFILLNNIDILATANSYQQEIGLMKLRFQPNGFGYLKIRRSMMWRNVDLKISFADNPKIVHDRIFLD